MIKSSFYLIVFCALISCQKKQLPRKVDETKAIETMMQNYRTAWVAGDSARVVNHLTDDMILFMPTKDGKPIVGATAISEFWFPKTDLSYPILSYNVTNEDIYFDNKLAYYQGISTLKWCTEENGVQRDTMLSVSEFTNILKKIDDKWKIHRIMYNSKNTTYSR